MPSSVKENYLKALFSLQANGQNTNVTELSKKLKVSKPTVNNMIKSLEEQGWVVYRKYKPVELTDKGLKAAALIIRKHRLTEVFLNKIMGFGWEEVHEIAEEMEHIKSSKLFDRMDHMLDYPTKDPHGSPIPNSNGNILEVQHLELSRLNIGDVCELSALKNSSNALLLYLNEKKIQLGTEIEIIKKEEFDDSLEICCDNKTTFTISPKVAKSLLVQIII
jgi:DtxR family Mn-dependent transcriptional regulator